MKLHGKTQIFISPNDAQLVTRASHSEIVANLAEDIARGLSLNEDLTRAIAKGHDIGHTAFGHAGEHELERICQEHYCYYNVKELKDGDRYNLERRYGQLTDEKLQTQVPIFEKVRAQGHVEELRREFFVQPNDLNIFSHAKQSFRFLCMFEGKQLTAQTTHGIISHKYNWERYADWDITLMESIKRVSDKNPLRQQISSVLTIENYKINNEHRTYEGEVVKFADFLAFSIHDLDDALRAGNLEEGELEMLFKQKFPHLSFSQYLVGSNRYTRYIQEFIKVNSERIKNGEPSLIKPSESFNVLGWVYDNITKTKLHNSPRIERRNTEGKRYIRGLYEIWKVSPDKILSRSHNLVPEVHTEFKNGYSSIRKFCDFISALTDNEIIMAYRSFYGPEQ